MTMCRLHAAALLVTLLTACSKPDTSTAPTASAVAVPTEAPTIAITGTPVAPSASALASASASAPAPASASAPAKPAPSAKGVTTTTAASATTATTAPPVALKPASSRLSGKNFVLDAASPGCRVDTPCTMTLHITAAGDYHVNKEYPYKFIAAAAPGVQFLGSADANTFSRATGDFRDDGEKAATLTVRFKPTAAGEARVSGTYKMSVCSAENCQIETPTVTLAVPVM